MARDQIAYLDPVLVSRLKNIEIKARLIVEGFITGLHKSPYHGFSVEFAEHRAYNSGDSLKAIDWKVYGRTNKLYTRHYEEETNLRCYIVLDISDSMRYPEKGISKLEYSAYLAAALSYLMVQQKDAVGLTLFDDELRTYIPPKARQSWLIQIYKQLEIQVQQAANFSHRTAQAPVLHYLAQKIGRRGLVILITDCFSSLHPLEALFPALQHLRHLKHEILIFNVLERNTESIFNFPDRPIILKDLETGEEIRVLPQEIRPFYQQYMQQYQAALRQKCRELNIDWVEIDTNTAYDRALTDYLIKRRTLQ